MIADEIRDYLVREVSQGRTVSDDTNLLEEEIIDSLGIFLLLSFIQERFGVEVRPEDVTLENFETIKAITRLVEDQRLKPV